MLYTQKESALLRNIIIKATYITFKLDVDLIWMRRLQKYFVTSLLEKVSSNILLLNNKICAYTTQFYTCIIHPVLETDKNKTSCHVTPNN